MIVADALASDAPGSEDSLLELKDWAAPECYLMPCLLHGKLNVRKKALRLASACCIGLSTFTILPMYMSIGLLFKTESTAS